MKVRFFDIKWDTDGNKKLAAELPKRPVLEVEDVSDLDNDAADILSDKYGWCVFSCDYEVIGEYGISPSQECSIPLPNGNFFVFPSAKVEPEGASYVRIVNSEGGELVYWSSDEWGEEPAFVMGAICGAMLDADKRKPEFYQFAPDCKFPDGIKYKKYRS